MTKPFSTIGDLSGLSSSYINRKENTMLSNDSTESQASQRSDTKAGTAKAQVKVLDPHSPIEVASQGSGTVNDPPASDTKPPGVTDYNFDLLAADPRCQGPGSPGKHPVSPVQGMSLQASGEEVEVVIGDARRLGVRCGRVVDCATPLGRHLDGRVRVQDFDLSLGRTGFGVAALGSLRFGGIIAEHCVLLSVDVTARQT